MTPTDFQVTWSKTKVKLMVFILSVVYSITYDLLLDGSLNLLPWLTIEKRKSLLLLRSQGQGQITGLISALSTQYFMNCLLDDYQRSGHYRVNVHSF